MAGFFECGVCNNIYDEAGKKPLMLLCGHTFCQQCLSRVVQGGSSACPSCRKRILSPINKLPVNFIAIPSNSWEAASVKVAKTKMFCISHQNELDYWCTQCKVLICKRCLVQIHAEHKLILVEEIFADEEILPDLKRQINANSLYVKAFCDNLQELESLSGIIDEVKSSIHLLKKSLLKQESTLNDLLIALEKISSEPSLEQKNLVLKLLKDQKQMQLGKISANTAPKPFQGQCVQCQIYNLPIEKCMSDGHPWVIISNEGAKKAVCVMKEMDCKTPKATVISTDESPILCLPELLQYLATSSTSMELQLMDKAVKIPYKKDWLPLKAGGCESKYFNHCYRLRTLADSLVHFQTLAAASNTVDCISNSTENKVVILVYPATRTYDICVLAFGKIVKSNTGSWPLPLEVHVIGIQTAQHFEWVKCLLPSLYYIAQPEMGECCVSLPPYVYGVNASELISVFAELGKKFSTQHRLFLPTTLNDKHYRHAAKAHKISLEFRDF